MFHGNGVFYLDGKPFHYEGPFVCGKKEGLGMLKNDATGDYFYAVFKDNIMVSPQDVDYHFGDGRIKRAHCENGELTVVK